MNKASKNLAKINENSKDTGLRVQTNGTFYVDRKIFYQRSEVRDTLKKMKESGVYP